MKFRKLMAVALIAAMAATMAVGCGGSSSDKSAEGSTDNSSADSGSDFDTSNDITIVSREDGSGTRGAVRNRRKTVRRNESRYDNNRCADYK